MYRSLREAANDLERHGQLKRIKTELDPNLEMAEVHRRVYEAQGPALLFENVKGSAFPALSNLYGTFDRTRFLFRDTLAKVQRIIELKIDPTLALKNPLKYWKSGFTALTALPSKSKWNKPIKYGVTTIDKLPLIKSWPMDGGAFVTLPQVFSIAPDDNNIMRSNLGMYRIQLTGNQYKTNEEIGLHYQLHRGIGVHHSQYNNSSKPFKVSVFVGGPPSHAFSAIMPLPESLSELTFAGLLNGRSFRYFQENGFYLSSDADFCITGTVVKNKKMPEGPFGDHLGYYSLEHEFPVMEVDKVYHRKDAIWHFTVVGRPPAEDSSFGYLIHELVKDLTPNEFPGLKDIHAVDAAGVHPLLLAIGSERYMPFREPKPEEILTIANRILGSGQTSLAKYLIIAANEDNPKLDTHDIPNFLKHVLERIDWKRDLHFHTNTTIDTLDYSGSGWNSGSKVVMACCGPKIRELSIELPENFKLDADFTNPSFALPGILLIKGKKYQDEHFAKQEMFNLEKSLKNYDLNGIAMIVLVDDSHFSTNTLNNFLWVTFTRSNPAYDIHGVGSFYSHKHWGCTGPLIIDARVKPHHAPTLEVDKKTKEKVDQLFAKGGELSGLI